MVHSVRVGYEAERAETYLRLLAEAALRGAPDPKSPAPPDRVRRAAEALIDAGVLADDQAMDILLMLGTALRVRGRREFIPAAQVRRLGGITARPGPSPGQAMAARAVAVSAASAPPEGSQARPPAAGDSWRVIPAPSSQARGSQLMALVITTDRMIAPATLRFPPSAGLDELEGPSFADLTASDDVGTDYQLTFTDGAWAGSSWTGTIQLRPPPPPSARLLTINSPNGPALLIPLTSPPARPVPGPVVAVDDSPGERLLIRRAEALLGMLSGTGRPPGSRWEPFGPEELSMDVRRAAVGDIIQALSSGVPLLAREGTGSRPVSYQSSHDHEPTLAELVETLEGAGILSPLSPVPAQVAALVDGLGWRVPGSRHGDRPAQQARLPARWASVLAYYGRRHHPPLAAGTGSIGAVLPEVDGASFVLAGTRASQQGTMLHVVGRGLRPVLRPYPDLRFSWWVRDDFGGWHVAVTQDWHITDNDLRLRLTVLPPLSPGEPGTASTLTLEVTGPRHQFTTDLKVRW